MKFTPIYLVLLFCIHSISIVNGDVDDIPLLPADFLEIKNALNFEGKTVLITGSNSGIGGTAVRIFASLGAQVVVTGRNKTRVKEVADDCYKLSPKKLKVNSRLQFENLNELLDEFKQKAPAH